jgi:hypothetical protein
MGMFTFLVCNNIENDKNISEILKLKNPLSLFICYSMIFSISCQGLGRVKIKPVIVTEHVDYPRTRKNYNLLSMEVIETGEIVDVVYNQQIK